MKSNSLVLDGLVVARDGAALTAPISLELAGGELLAIHGSNGSGKSTLLKTVAGLIPLHRATSQHSPTSNLALKVATGTPLPRGEVETLLGVSGEGALTPAKSHPILYNNSWPITPRPVYLGHKRGLTPSMSVLDNVAFWAKASGHPELTDAALHYFELADIPNVAVESLSAGWQQRVALTRLITMPSGVWLLDEPTSNLDAEGINLLHSLVQTRLEQGGIVLIATHLQLQGEKVRELNINALNGKAEVIASC